MKSLKSMTEFTLAIFAMMLVLSSCSKEEMNDVQATDVVAQEHIAQLQALNFNTTGIQVANVSLPDGTYEKSYIVEGDIALPVAQIENFLQKEIVNIPDTEQRRSPNLVTSTSTINVLGYTGGSFALTSKMRTGLSWAVNNYNAVPNMSLSFNLSFGTNFSSADIVVYKVNGAAGGSAGFPSGGNPYKWLRVNSGTDAFATNFVEAVITHEMGHCIGMAHTDGPGILIAGTPTADANSIFNTTFPVTTNGELSFWDRIALSIIY